MNKGHASTKSEGFVIEAHYSDAENPGGTKVDWHLAARDGQNGKVTIGDRTFTPADGSFFLVSTQVRQTKPRSVKSAFASAIALFALCLGRGLAEGPADTVEARNRGAAHLAELVAQPWLAGWKNATLEEPRLVEQKKDLTWSTRLPPAWWAKVISHDGSTGYLAWDSDGPGKLIEFTFDGRLEVNAPDAKALKDVPAMQQFAIQQKDGPPTASGCVPTAATSVVGHWTVHGFPQWRGDAESLRQIVHRIRARLKMEAITDKDGYTDDGMALAGAFPDDLARAIQEDADALKVPVQSSAVRFRYGTLQSEIDSGRPVLLSCIVRLPHKPHLSWGHEVAGIGWAKIGEEHFVGVIDNFFPVRNPATIRWIRADAFESLITIRPAPSK